MTEMNRVESVASEAAILVGVVLPHHEIPGEPLEELEGLATTAGSRVVGHLTQRRQAPDVTTYLGKGKVEELKQLAAAAASPRAPSSPTRASRCWIAAS